MTDTAPESPSTRDLKRARLARRALLAVFATVLALGATGRLGVRTAHATNAAGGYELEVEYPRVTRPGHAVPLSVQITKSGGFGGEPIQLRMSTTYFALFDENGVQPAPSTETATRTDLMWEFDPPPGDVLRIYFDTRTGPNVQRGRTGEVTVLDNGTPAVSVRIKTTVMP